MVDKLDEAFLSQERFIDEARQAVQAGKHTFTVIFMTDDGIEEKEFFGSGGGCVLHMEETLGIDLINGRWARGFSPTSIKASDGVMEDELRRRLTS